MTSSRLPGKVLMETCGKPMLELQVERLLKVKAIDEIVLATTINTADDPIVKLAERIGVNYYRGSEEDVLNRVLNAAQSCEGDMIVEITGDCPLVDPQITSQIIQLYLRNECDYASNLDPVTFPIGFDSQVFSVELLVLADKETDLPTDREHVSWFIRRQPKRFKKLHLPAPQDLEWPELALTLDEFEDFQLLKTIFEHFYPKRKDFTATDIIRYFRQNPKLLEINKNVSRTKLD